MRTVDVRAAKVAREAAALVKRLEKQALKDVVEIGRALARVKRSLPHGAWGAWLQTEFRWSERVAQNYMRVAEVGSNKSVAGADLPLSVVFELAAQSTPEAAREEILGRVAEGERVTRKEARGVISAAKGKPSPSPEPSALPAPAAAVPAALPTPIVVEASSVQVELQQPAEEAQQRVVAADPMALAAEAIEAVGVRAMASALLRHMLGDEERDDLSDGDIAAAFVAKVYRKAESLPAATIEALMRDIARGVAMVASDAVSERRAPSTAPAALEISTRRGDIAEAHRTKIAGAFAALAEAERRAGMAGARVDPAALVGKKPQREPEPEPDQPRRVAIGEEFDD